MDAFEECATVTWCAGLPANQSSNATFAEARSVTPARFKETFASVRPYCRTMADFMVTNLAPAPVASREDFERLKSDVGDILDEMAARAALVRERWRSVDEQQWLDAHAVPPQVSVLMRSWASPVHIVSAKDEPSIRVLLRHHRLDDTVRTVHGAVSDKRSVLKGLASAGPVVFVDDNLDNAASANELDDVLGLWADWGYSAPDDTDRARRMNIRRIALDDLKTALRNTNIEGDFPCPRPCSSP